MKHTQGKWETGKDAEGWWVCEEGNGADIADFSLCDNAEANARLIASAPELLEALEECLDQLSSWQDNHEEDTFTMKRAKEVINKARGV